MKADYWNVEEAQVVEKTGKTIQAWSVILQEFGSVDRKSNELVAFL